MTDLESLAHSATRELLERSTPDVTSRYVELRRIRTRRTTAKLVAAAAALAVAVGGWQVAAAHPRHGEPAAPAKVMNNGALLGEDHTPHSKTEGWHSVMGFPPVGLPTDFGDDALAQFAPDGQLLYYGDDHQRLASWDLTDGSKHVLTGCPRAGCSGSSVSPDGTTALVLGEHTVQLVSLGTGEHHRLAVPAGGPGAPMWSPDGRRVAFTNSDGLYVEDSDGSDLHLVHPATSRADSYPESVAWSPDGSRIAFFDTIFSGPYDVAPRYNLMTIHPDGSSPESLHDAGFCGCGRRGAPHVTWSPDGGLIAVASGDLGPGTGVYTVQPDGSEWVLWQRGDFAALTWQPVVG